MISGTASQASYWHWEEPILFVSQQPGHSSAAFTLSPYAHLIQHGRKLDKEETQGNWRRRLDASVPQGCPKTKPLGAA